MRVHQTRKPSAQQRKKNDRIKRQLTNWEKTFANYKSDEGLRSKLYKELIQLNSKKANTNIPHFIPSHFIVLCRYFFFLQISLWQLCIKWVCCHHFSTAHFTSLCHILVVFTIFQTYPYYFNCMVICDQWWLTESSDGG